MLKFYGTYRAVGAAFDSFDLVFVEGVITVGVSGNFVSRDLVVTRVAVEHWLLLVVIVLKRRLSSV